MFSMREQSSVPNCVCASSAAKQNTLGTNFKTPPPYGISGRFFIMVPMVTGATLYVYMERFQVSHLIKYRSKCDNTFYELSIITKLISTVRGLICVCSVNIRGVVDSRSRRWSAL